jgi:tRNA(fMet)-specific endonuclease VapC
MYMLDTNICSYIIKKRPPQVLAKFEQIPHTDISISVITLAELQYGVTKSTKATHNQTIIDAFVSRLEVLPWTFEITQHYGQIRTDLERQGTPIGSMDLLIAAHCISLDATLVTNNTREFNRIPQLKLENWVEKV